MTAGAYQDGAEHWKGRLTPGMVADVCVLDGSLPTVPEEVPALASLPVALTVLDGRVAYQRPSSTSRYGAATTAATATSAAATAGCTHGQTCCCTRAPQLLAGHG